MKSKMRILATLLVVLFVGAFLAACANDAPAPAEPTPAPPADAGDAQADAPATPPPAADGETVVLTFYGFSEWVDSAPHDAYFNAAVAQFESEFPGFTIDLQSDPWGDWATQYVAMFAAGNPTDIFFVGNDMFAEFANAGHLLNLDDWVEPGFFDAYFPGVQGMYNWQGMNQAIAFTTDTRILWWNKELFEQAGLDPDTPPTTWAELASFANQIREETGRPGFGMDLGLTEFPQQALFCASEGSVISVAADGTITPTVDTNEFRTFLQTLIDMLPAFQDDFSIQNHHDVAELYAAGEFGMIIGNTLAATDIRDRDWYGNAFVPSIDGRTHGSFGGGFGIGVAANTAHPEQAVRFAQILTSPEFNALLISDFPTTAAGMANSELAADPTLAIYVEQIEYARQGQPKTLYFMEIDNAVHMTITEVLVDGISVDDAVEALTNRILAIIS